MTRQAIEKKIEEIEQKTGIKTNKPMVCVVRKINETYQEALTRYNREKKTNYIFEDVSFWICLTRTNEEALKPE